MPDEVFSSTPIDPREHLVVIVPGIRDYGLWVEDLAQPLRQKGFLVAPATLNYFNLLMFLVPGPLFKNAAVNEIWRYIQDAMVTYPQAKHITFLAHSFGSYIVARLLRDQFTLGTRELKVANVIFFGSIVPRRFEFELVYQRIQKYIVNEVGAYDPWPVIAESFLFGYGNPGTVGFRRSYVKDRWHTNAGHHFYISREFQGRWWLPILMGAAPADGDPPQDMPLWLKLLSIFKLKYLIAAIAIGWALILGIQLVYPPRPLSSQVQTPSTRMGAPEFPSIYPQAGLIEVMTAEVNRPCPMGPICPPAFLQQLIWGRTFGSAFVDGALANLATLKAFDYPPKDTAVYDPMVVFRTFAEAFPTCVSVDETGPQPKVMLKPDGVAHKARPNAPDLLICKE